MKKLLLAGVAAGMLAVHAPVANAAVVRSGCVAVTPLSPTVNALYGYAIFDDEDRHTLRCSVAVGGVDTYGVEGSGTGYVTTVGAIPYVADPYAQLCTEIDGTTLSCGSYYGFPPIG